MTSPRHVSEDTFLRFAIEYGRCYLAAGGPSNRLEDHLSALAARHGLKAEVFATPTGIFVTVGGAGATQDKALVTAIGRIKEYIMNLNQLCWLEALVDDIAAGKTSVGSAAKILRTSRFRRPLYSTARRSLAALAMGCAVSYPTFGLWESALVSGLIAYVTYWLTGPGLARLAESAVFRDFIGSLFTLLSATLAAHWLGGPVDSYSIGGIILLVPGLTITTAISELADQNFISGTAKLMKGILTLLSIGIAYLLFQELMPSLPLRQVVTRPGTPSVLWTSALGTVVSVFGFSVIFQVPRKALPWATLTGLMSWAVFNQFTDAKYLVLASFLASATVGMVSLAIGQRFRTPSQVYSVPGVLALLPGMLALSAFRSFAAGQEDNGLQTAFKVALMAGTIVFGLFFARVPFAAAQGLVKSRRQSQ